MAVLWACICCRYHCVSSHGICPGGERATRLSTHHSREQLNDFCSGLGSQGVSLAQLKSDHSPSQGFTTWAVSEVLARKVSNGKETEKKKKSQTYTFLSLLALRKS